MADVQNHISLVMPRSTGRLDAMRETIVEFLKGNHVDDGPISRIELSIYEAVVNIIEHSSPAYSDRDIRIECEVGDRGVTTTISHYGDKFDVTKAQLPDIEKHYKSGKMRGLGIYFIMTLMDKVEYAYEGGTSRLMMFKRI